MLAGVLPTPAVALLALDLGVVISASHNPPEYNGVKFFDRDGQKLTDAAEEEIEALFDAPFDGPPGQIDHVGVADRQLPRPRRSSASAPTCPAWRSSSTARTAPTPGSPRPPSSGSEREVTRSASDPDGTNINVGCGATDLTTLQQTVSSSGADLGIAFDGDGDRMLAVDARGNAVDGDQILAILCSTSRSI